LRLMWRIPTSNLYRGIDSAAIFVVLLNPVWPRPLSASFFPVHYSYLVSFYLTLNE
jgi:hypothetical protein